MASQPGHAPLPLLLHPSKVSVLDKLILCRCRCCVRNASVEKGRPYLAPRVIVSRAEELGS